MLNVYDYHTDPESLMQSTGPFEFKFSYEDVDDAANYIASQISEENEEFEEIIKAFEIAYSKYDTYVSSNGHECALFPTGKSKSSNFAIYLYTYENMINGDYVLYGTRTRFCQSERVLENNQTRPDIVRDVLVSGMKALAIDDLND